MVQQKIWILADLDPQPSTVTKILTMVTPTNTGLCLQIWPSTRRRIMMNGLLLLLRITAKYNIVLYGSKILFWGIPGSAPTLRLFSAPDSDPGYFLNMHF